MLKFLNKTLCLSVSISALALASFASHAHQDEVQLEPVYKNRHLLVERNRQVDSSQLQALASKNISLADVTVNFKKNWRRDYNSQFRSLDDHISEKDEAKIQQKMAKLFNQYYRQELSEREGYKLQDDAALEIRPHLKDLVIYAPDTKTPSIEKYVHSAGKSKLVLEVYHQGKLVGIISDKSETTDHLMLRRASSVFNRAEFKQLIRRWARDLQEDMAHLRAS